MRWKPGSLTRHNLPARSPGVKPICRSAKGFRLIDSARRNPYRSSLPLAPDEGPRGGLRGVRRPSSLPVPSPLRLMNLQVRLHDAVDQETVLRRLLPVLAGARGERRAAYAAYDDAAHVLVHRWSATEGGGVEES